MGASITTASEAMSTYSAARAATPGPRTSEGQQSLAVTFLLALFTLAIAEGWIRTDDQVRTFVLSWLPILIGGLTMWWTANRTYLKARIAQAAALAQPTPAPAAGGGPKG